MSRKSVFACEPGWEAALIAELSRVFPECHPSPRGDGWIILDGEVADSLEPTVALASQCLPAGEPITASSIAECVRTVGPRLIDLLAQHDGPWRLHVFAISGPNATVRPRRTALIENGLVEWLRKKQRRLLRSRNETMADSAPVLAGSEGSFWPDKAGNCCPNPFVHFVDDEAFAQIGLMTPQTGWLSVTFPSELWRLRRCVSPFVGGVVKIGPDRKAPSRAFTKLHEAELRIGRYIESGQTCVDLGSSPGSWAYVALRRGASLTAVDRCPLRGDLMRNPRLKFVRGDAFRFEPESPVDWLLCDVVAAPERSIELLKRWLDNRWCRRFCVTIKFRGAGDYEKLEDAKSILQANDCDFLLRRLTSNKNEVTAVGERPGR